MNKITKIFLIFLVIVLFSNGVINFLAIFFDTHRDFKFYLVMSIINFNFCHAINEEILLHEEYEN